MPNRTQQNNRIEWITLLLGFTFNKLHHHKFDDLGSENKTVTQIEKTLRLSPDCQELKKVSGQQAYLLMPTPVILFYNYYGCIRNYIT